MKILSKVFWTLAVLLSDIMCAVVAYNYCNLYWSGKYMGGSAPADVAFFLAIPFIIGIIVCIILAVLFRKKGSQTDQEI